MTIFRTNGFPEETSPILEKLQLPLPGEDELYSATGCRSLLLLSEAGLVVQLAPKKTLMPFNNPHFLQPLFTRETKNYQVRIEPGIDCPMAGEDEQIPSAEQGTMVRCGRVINKRASEAYLAMKRRFNITVGDAKSYNIGLIPGTNFPALIDLDPHYITQAKSYKLLKQSVGLVRDLLIKADILPKEPWKEMFTMAEPDDYSFQKNYYKTLIDTITTAWPADKHEPDADGIRAFFQMAKDFKKDGKLMSKWENHDYLKTSQIAQNYAKRLKICGL